MDNDYTNVDGKFKHKQKTLPLQPVPKQGEGIQKELPNNRTTLSSIKGYSHLTNIYYKITTYGTTNHTQNPIQNKISKQLPLKQTFSTCLNVQLNILLKLHE